MNANAKPLIVAGAMLGFLGVAIGAFGAHAVKTRIDADLLTVYQTGVQYHLVHALAILLIGILVQVLPSSKAIRVAGWMMVIGVILFSGSLYALSLSGVRMLGAVTPFGGLALLTAWLMVIIGVMRLK